MRSSKDRIPSLNVPITKKYVDYFAVPKETGLYAPLEMPRPFEFLHVRERKTRKEKSMKFTFEVSEIHILLGMTGPDKIYFQTNLPSPYPSMRYEADLAMTAQKNHAEEYVRDNFPGVPVKIINANENK